MAPCQSDVLWSKLKEEEPYTVCIYLGNAADSVEWVAVHRLALHINAGLIRCADAHPSVEKTCLQETRVQFYDNYVLRSNPKMAALQPNGGDVTIECYCLSYLMSWLQSQCAFQWFLRIWATLSIWHFCLPDAILARAHTLLCSYWIFCSSPSKRYILSYWTQIMQFSMALEGIWGVCQLSLLIWNDTGKPHQSKEICMIARLEMVSRPTSWLLPAHQ